MVRIFFFISVLLCFSFSIQAQSNNSNTEFDQAMSSGLESKLIHPDSLNQVDEMGRKQGAWKVKNMVDGKWILKEEGIYLNNRKSGYWRDYYPSGKIKNLIFFADGRPNGFCELYYENGNIREKGNFQKNRYIGEYLLYYKSGQVQNKFNYNEKGKRHGMQYYFHENGLVAIEGEFNDGKELWYSEFFESGKLKEKNYTDSLKLCFYEHGICKSVERFIRKEEDIQSSAVLNSTSYSDKGKKALHGLQYYYYKNGNLKRKCKYENGRSNGELRLYHPNEVVKMRGNYTNGKMSGERIYYDETGNLVKGDFKFYDEDGNIERSGYCIEGKPEGYVFVYDSDGKLILTANHMNGKPHGITRYYNKEGQIYFQEEYSDGVFKESKSFEYIK